MFAPPEEANIVMDYPALNVEADYLARTTPKLESIYTTEILSKFRRQGIISQLSSSSIGT